MTEFSQSRASEYGGQLESDRARSRVGGQVLLVGSLGVILATVLVVAIPGPYGSAGPESVPSTIVFMVSYLLVLAGLPALYRVQAAYVKTAGKVGVGMIAAAIVFAFVEKSFDLTMPDLYLQPQQSWPPLVFVVALVSLLGAVLLLVAGGIILGVKMIRGTILPRAAGWLLIVGSIIVVIFMFFPYSGIVTPIQLGLYLVGLAWSGAAIGFPRVKAQTPTSPSQGQ